MARITVEDCLKKIPSRFALVMIASQRTKQLLKGAPLTIEESRDNKEIVNSLREIAAGTVDIKVEVEQPDTQPDEQGTADIQKEEDLANG